MMDRDNGQGEESRKSKKFRFTLRVKMNLLIAAGILVTSLCLLGVAYRTHCSQVDELYLDEAQRAARTAAGLISPEVLDSFSRSLNVWSSR